MVEIGTYTGMGSVALMQGQEKGILYTFDVLPWDEFQTHLTKRYFEKNEIIVPLEITGHRFFQQIKLFF